jgi:LmbE family N-acetylglucosaminyl deacetylase
MSFLPQIKRILIAVFVVALAVQGQQTQTPTPTATQAPPTQTQATVQTDAQLYQALLDLTNPWTVMCVAAHPDDEDGTSLTVLRRKYGVHTVSLFSTFGEGGQNAVGPELYEDLGVIRAHETMAAAEVQGSEPHFLGFRDFGFSKSAEETFKIWGGARELLRRMVLEIRRLRPDAIITNHDTTSGHGNHQATGRMILQAFDAAADPKQFPEQLNEVSVWQVQRLFVRTRGGDTAAGQTFAIDPNETDPARGTTYAQQALAALQKHATQGPWPKTVPAGGGRVSHYTLVKQAPNTAPLPAGAKTPLDGLKLPEQLSERLSPPTIEGKPLTDLADRRLEVLVALINARRRGAFTAPNDVMALDAPRFQLMSSRLDKALAVATGVTVNLNPEGSALVPGEKARIVAALSNNGVGEVQIKQVKFRVLGVEAPLNVADKMLPGTETTAQIEFTTPKTAKFTVPASEHLYDDKLFGEPLVVNAELGIEGITFNAATELDRKVAPAVEILDVEPTPYVTTPATSQKPLEFKVKLQNHLAGSFRGLLRVRGPSLETGKEIELQPDQIDTSTVVVRSLALTGLMKDSNVDVTVDLPNPKDPIAKKVVPLVYADAIVVAGRKVGYLPSYDKTLERALSSLGVDARQLTIDDIAKSDLSVFNTIVLDNRPYEAHPELVGLNARLLKFVEDGGTLVVFYSKTGEWNPDPARNRPQLAPYPIILGDERVTLEDAPVTFLAPRNFLLHFPNRITQTDFANWVQERGLYFPREWDSHYTPVLATSDKGEQPLRGGLLVAPYGRGNYIYTSFVWYRQLRAGLPGGYRFFANMISYGRPKGE